VGATLQEEEPRNRTRSKFRIKSTWTTQEGWYHACTVAALDGGVRPLPLDQSPTSIDEG